MEYNVGMQVVSISERPDLAAAAFAIPYGLAEAPFMQGSPVSLLVRRRRFVDRWPDYVLVLMEDDAPIARGVSVPFCASAEDRQRYPDGGWEQVAIWAAEDAMDRRPHDTVCALEIVVHPEHYGRGLSEVMLGAMRERASAGGHEALVAPVRPPDKANEPSTPMSSYASRTRGDGLPEDRWLRVHARAGGRMVGIAACSATVQAPLSAWRRWTGLPFDRDGFVVVRGGLVPVFVSARHDIAVYVEPNVWVLHAG